MTDEKDLTGTIDQARKIMHDMNQPLTVIMARSELMMLKIPPDSPHRKAVEQIHQQGEKLASLIDDLRTILRSLL
ncbi:MAG: hypothetical protein HQK55_06315 [Deltaproteobacteria bacterium]|nr:hypothetical protein [Deltaproteobacteria bacterium]